MCSDCFDINLPLTGDRPESACSSFVPIPVVFVGGSSKDALPRMVLCVTFVGLAESISSTGDHLLHLRHIGPSESIQFGNLDQQFPLKYFKESLSGDGLMLFGKVVSADGPQRRRFSDTLWTFEDD